MRMDWDYGLDKWVGDYKYEWEFDDAGVDKKYYSFIWDKDVDIWLDFYKIEYEKDIFAGRIEEGLGYVWSADSGKWNLESKYEYGYDVMGFLSLYVASYWNSDGSQWVYSWKYEYVNNSKGEELNDTYLTWDSETAAWRNANMYEYSYNANGDYTLNSYFSAWDADSNVWLGDYKYVYEYDANGNRTLYQYFSGWDYYTYEWIPEFKYNYVWDDNNKRTLYESYDWKPESKLWEGQFRYEYAYDEKGNLVMESYYPEYNLQYSAWVGSTKFEFRHDEYGNRDFMLGYEWDDWKNEFKFSFNIFYYLTDIGNPALINPLPKEVLEIYPNPSDGIFNLKKQFEESTAVQIFTADGRMVYQCELPAFSNRVDLGHLKKGVYIMRLSNNNCRYSTILILR